MQCAHPHRGMTTQDSQRLRGAAGNMGLEPEDLGLNFTVTTSLSISSFVHHLEPQSPTSLAPGTSFMEDNFSSDQGPQHTDTYRLASRSPGRAKLRAVRPVRG